MVRLTWLLLSVLGLPYLGEAYKILTVFPFPGKSHSILGEGYVRLLLEAGHEVTYITPFPQKDPPPNLHEIDVSSNMAASPVHLINIEAILKHEVDPTDMDQFVYIILNLSRMTYTHENVQKLLNDPNQNFDIIIVEWMFSELGSGLSALYECPFIWFSTIEPHWLALSLVDDGLNPAYNSDSMSGHVPPFNFPQRVVELWSQIKFYFIRQWFLLPPESIQYEEIFGPLVAKRGKVLPPYEVVRFNASLMLGNSHVSLGQATRLPQNYKPIAGYHIEPKVKPLPEDLKRILDNEKNGVIYFSMGSNLKSKDMPNELKMNLLKMFAGLKYTVLWKFEEVLPDLPKNVHILHWAPQQSILAHPNCILFITHGGLLSTTETVHFGVPIIGIPVFADQFINVDRAVQKGFAKRLDLSYTMADDLKVAIEDAISNPRYREKVKQLSLVYNDRPAPAGTELVHWVEHVVRTRGAPHLRSPALHVPWYQKMYLDLLAIIVVAIILLKKAIKRLFCSRKDSKISKTSKQKKNN